MLRLDRLRAIQWPSLRASLVVLVAFVFAFFSAALIGLGSVLPVLLVYGLGIMGALIMLGMAEPSARQMRWLLVTVLAVTLLHPLLDAVAHVPIGYLFELLCFTLLVGAAISAFQRYQASPWFKVLLLLIACFFLFGLLSTVAGRSKPLASLWQFQYNLKLPAMLLIGMLLAYDEKQELWFMRFVGWAWLPLAAFVALEMFAPSRYTGLMNQAIDHTPNPLIGVGVRRAGLFPHSGYLAMAVAILAWTGVVYGVIRRQKRWLLPILAYFALLLLSGQRQETLAFLLAVSALGAYVFRRHWRVLLVCAVLGGGVVVLSAELLGLGVGQRLLDQWGGGSALDQVSERYVLTETGIQIAKEWAPLGSGLGTYGGAGAQKFDQSQFLAYGFDRFWWFRQGMFLVDVYWPSVLAEAGFIGAGAWVLFFGALLLLLARNAWRSGLSHPLPWLALGGLVVLLGNSPTSAALTDPRLSFWIWLLIGAGTARALRQDLSGKGAP